MSQHIFLQLTRQRDGVLFLSNLDCIQRIIPADNGSNICWSNEDEVTQVTESYNEIHERISKLVGAKTQ